MAKYRWIRGYLTDSSLNCNRMIMINDSDLIEWLNDRMISSLMELIMFSLKIMVSRFLWNFEIRFLNLENVKLGGWANMGK